MNYYTIADDVRKKIHKLVDDFFAKCTAIDLEKDDWHEDDLMLDLTNSGINPSQLMDVLKEDYKYSEDTFDTNGWDWDFWQTMSNDDFTEPFNRIKISGTGITFELYLQVGINLI